MDCRRRFGQRRGTGKGTFGFRFLAQVLFGDESIPMHQDAAGRRLRRSVEKSQRLEREAALRREDEQDGMYESIDD